jgi:hypothetical protein
MNTTKKVAEDLAREAEKKADGAAQKKAASKKPAPKKASEIANFDEPNFQRPRKKRLPDPKISFFELFLTRLERDGKTYHFSFRDQISRGVKWGRYANQVMKDKFDAFVDKLKNKGEYDPDMARKSSAKSPFGEYKGGKEKRPPASPADPARFAKDVNKMTVHGGRAGSDRSDHDVEVNIRDTSHGIASNQVGPERQVELSDEPFPLAKPKEKSAPARITYVPDEVKKAADKQAENSDLADRVCKKAREIKDTEDAETAKEDASVKPVQKRVAADEPEL